MFHVQQLNNPEDFATQGAVANLYRGVFNFTPVLHHILTGASGAALYLVYERDGNMLVGAGVLRSAEALAPIGAETKPLAYAVTDMVTDPAWRRQGVARLLLRHLEGQASRQGGRILYLYTDKDNRAATNLYVSHGFSRLADQSGQAVFARFIGS